MAVEACEDSFRAELLRAEKIPFEVMQSPSLFTSLIATPEQGLADKWLSENVCQSGDTRPLATVILFDVSGSQMKSAKELLKLANKIAEQDVEDQVVVIPFGNRRELLMYNKSRDCLPSNVFTRLSRMPPLSSRAFAEKLQNDLDRFLALQSSGYTARANEVKPFNCKTHSDAIKIGLQLLNNRGFFEGRKATLVFLGDGEFDGGIAELPVLLEKLDELKLLERFVRLVMVPSPHTPAPTWTKMHEYTLDICRKIHGIVPQVVPRVDLKKWVGDVLKATNVKSKGLCLIRDGVPYKAIYSRWPVICHVGLQSLSRMELATLFELNQTAAKNVVQTVEAMLDDPLQLERLASDRIFSALYAGLISCFRHAEEETELTKGIQAIMNKVSQMMSISSGTSTSHREVLRQTLMEARRDPIVDKWLASNNFMCKMNGVDFLIKARKGNALDDVVLQDMISPAPKKETRRAVIGWFSSIETFPPSALDEMDTDFVNVLAVPAKRAPEDTVRVVKLLPTLSQDRASWSSRVILQVALMTLANLRPAKEENGEEESKYAETFCAQTIDPRVAKLLMDCLIQNDWSSHLELCTKNSENFSGFFVQLVSQFLSVFPESKFCDPKTAKMYQEIGRLQRLRSAIERQHVSVQTSYWAAPAGKVSRMQRTQVRATKTKWGIRFEAFLRSFLGVESDVALQTKDIQPFLFGVPVCEDGLPPDELLHALCLDVDVWEHFAQNRRGRALRIVLDYQLRLFEKSHSIDTLLQFYGAEGDSIPTFTDKHSGKLVVDEFFLMQGECKLVEHTVQFPFSIRDVLRLPQVCQYANLDQSLVNIALSSTGRISMEQAEAAMERDGFPQPFEFGLVEQAELPVRGCSEVTKIVLTEEKLACIAEQIRSKLSSKTCGTFAQGSSDIRVSPFESCGVCMMEFSATSYSWTELECGHRLCFTCADRWIDMPSRGLLVEPKCPFCRAAISSQFLEKHGKRTFARILEQTKPWMLESYVLVCERCKGAYVGANRACRVRIEALDKLCSPCQDKKEETEARAAEEAAQKSERTRREENRILDQAKKCPKTKKCPRCSVQTLKDGGCNHMSCPCGAHWCWRCGKDRKGGSPFTGRSIYSHSCFKR